MELLRQMSNVQLLYPAAAVAVVLILAAFVFIFGFHSAEQPQFDKLPLVVDDKKSANKKKKIKEKKSSPNRTASEDSKTKSESSKKSPIKEKREEKTKEAEKPKPKETKPTESKFIKKEATPAESKKGKKSKGNDEKPADFDDGGWQEVPKKSEKKKVKPEEKDVKVKKDSPVKKNKKKTKDTDVEAARTVDEPAQTIRVLSVVGPNVNVESANDLQAQIAELQRVLKERERLDQVGLDSSNEVSDEQLTEVKDLRSNKKKENKEKQIKKKTNEVAMVNKNGPEVGEKVNSDSSIKKEENVNTPVFDELGDTWTDAKVSKKSKKKARKDQ